MKDLVVSIYGEDISWLDTINFADRVFLYNKGQRKIPGSIELPNVGREAHTFVHHIVSNYHDLADHTVFLQGRPFDHMGGVDPSNINQRFLEHDFKYDKEPALNGYMMNDWTGLTARCYEAYFEGPAPHIMFSPGAQWIVPKEYVLSKSLSFYQSILNELSVHRYSNSDGMVNAWVMEGLWNYVFDKDVREKSVNV